MISEFFINLAMGFATWVVGLFPDWDPPAELVNFATTVNGFIAGFSGLGVWVPWPLLIVCVSVSVGAWVMGLGVKSVRAIVAHLPFVGGAG